MKKFILIAVMIVGFITQLNGYSSTKDSSMSQTRIKEIKQARQKIEQLRKNGKLLYFNNEHRDGKNYTFTDTATNTFMNTGRSEDMAGGLAFVHFYAIFAVLLIAFFLLIKKIPLF